MGFIVTIISGILAGWLAGKIMNSKGTWLRNLILGLVGGVVGSFVLKFIGVEGKGLIGGTLVSVIGACLLIWISRILTK